MGFWAIAVPIITSAISSLIDKYVKGGDAKGGESGTVAEGGGTIKDQMPVKQAPSAPLMGFPSVSNTNYGDIVKAVMNRQRGGIA